MTRYWWHRLRGHRFAFRAPDQLVCLNDLAVMRRPRRGQHGG